MSVDAILTPDIFAIAEFSKTQSHKMFPEFRDIDHSPVAITAQSLIF
jgi:hypothetical protein